MQNYENVLRDHARRADFWSIFVQDERHEEIGFRKGIQEPIYTSEDHGALITVSVDGGYGYASTQDLSDAGLRSAYDQAWHLAHKFSHLSLLKNIKNPFSAHRGKYVSPVQKTVQNIPLDQKLAILEQADRELMSHSLIIDSAASLWSIDTETLYQNSLGSEIYQTIHRVVPGMNVTAHKGDVAQTRTLGGLRANCQQGGYEAVLALDLPAQAHRIVKDAVDLVNAINCPTDVMDVLIDPDQMMLQIHESIGHPLELDRILGDERNYAGTSFVTLDMFGHFQYGSSLLNITFDPTIPEEFASYAFDDEGTKAEREFLIKDGKLIRPLGGAVAQARAGMPGVANARTCSWNRPPIDRMANLNLEPGDASFADMVSSIDKGVYLKSNASWSIDDSRNKFQFGCEWGQLIEKGRFTKIVRNPNYRGISSSFWRSLKMVGDASTLLVMGSPYCGKGEPNQCIRVGHASPVCLFNNIDVFGGE